jgi:hypothetical protein
MLRMKIMIRTGMMRDLKRRGGASMMEYAERIYKAVIIKYNIDRRNDFIIES